MTCFGAARPWIKDRLEVPSMGRTVVSRGIHDWWGSSTIGRAATLGRRLIQRVWCAQADDREIHRKELLVWIRAWETRRVDVSGRLAPIRMGNGAAAAYAVVWRRSSPGLVGVGPRF